MSEYENALESHCINEPDVPPRHCSDEGHFECDIETDDGVAWCLSCGRVR